MTRHSYHKEGESQTSGCQDQYSCCWTGFRDYIVEDAFLMIADLDGELIGGGTAYQSFSCS